MNNSIVINDRTIGAEHPPYIIAELSANHNGSLERALATIEAAYHAGADAIKLQTYRADTMTIDCDNELFQVKGGLWDGYSLYKLYEWAHTPYEWHKALFDKAHELGITVFSTPFDESAVDLLESLDTPAYKIASFEATDLPLIKRVCKTGKPVIISTGMANLEEIEDAVTAAQSAGCTQLVLLHCISAYPAPADQANLKTICDLARRFDVQVGLSDHTLGNVVSIAAVGQGAVMIEKHFTLSRQEHGPDSAFSIEPDELASLCQDSRTAWDALGQVSYERKPAEQASLTFRRSLFFVKPVQAGEIITPSHIRRIRPGYGLSPKYLEHIIGKRARTDIARGTPVQWELIDK